MNEQHRDEPSRLPPGPQLHPIEERDSSPNSSASTETLATSPKKQTNDEPQTPGPSKQQLELEQQNQQKTQNGNTSTPLNEQPPPLSSRPSMARQPTESGSVYYGHQTPSLANRTWSQQQASQWPTHSLAGNNMMPIQPQISQQNNTYVDPEYRQKNPRYGRENEKPIWGLAKPLPRVVRPGMRRDEKDQTTAQESGPPGESAPAPELGATPGLSPPQPGNKGQGYPSYSSTAQQGLAKQNAVYAPQADGLLRPMESEASQGINPQGSNQPMDEQSQEEFLNLWVKVRHYMKEPFAEFLATTVAVLIGLCGTLAVSTGGASAGNRLSENWSWGLGFMIGIYLAGGISGAHLNPGISITLWVFRGFPGRRCCYYIVAQVLGAITAAGLTYCLYRDAILSLAPTAPPGASGLGLYTEPLGHVSSATAFFTEFIADAVLLCVIFAMGDDSNAPPGAGMHSFVIGLVIYVLCICLGFNTGGCLNPVRDFGPRLIALMAGYGGHTFTDHQGWWFWGCWVATISGCLTGGSLYDTFIFIGGESPINYAPRRRHRAKLKKETKWRKRLGIGMHKVPHLEDGIKNLEED